jgi:hypothetical protein
MQNGRKRHMNTRQPRPARPAGRSQRWAPSPPRAERRGSHNARRNYDRYLALAQAELQAGDRVAAENYYQHAEHYFRLMGTSKNSCFTRACANLMREILIRGGDDGSAGIFRCR